MIKFEPLPHVASPPLAPGAGPLREDKFPTHDGAIWPVERARMATPNAIRARMSEDAADLIRAQGAEATVTQDDLVRQGWDRWQVNTHGSHAIRKAAEAVETLASLVALGLFCAGSWALYAGYGGL